MEGTAGLPKGIKDERCWRDFAPGRWRNAIDVRDFILRNVTPYEGDEKKKGRQFFHGAEHSGFRLEAHETILGPGTETHAPHKHEHEEIVILVEGTLETYVDGKTEKAEPGSVVYLGSNQMHSVRNAGTIPARYYVIELRGREA